MFAGRQWFMFEEAFEQRTYIIEEWWRLYTLHRTIGDWKARRLWCPRLYKLPLHSVQMNDTWTAGEPMSGPPSQQSHSVRQIYGVRRESINGKARRIIKLITCVIFLWNCSSWLFPPRALPPPSNSTALPFSAHTPPDRVHSIQKLS